MIAAEGEVAGYLKMTSSTLTPSCAICNELEAYSLEITVDQLAQGAEAECKSCQFLLRGIRHFAAETGAVEQLELRVDYSLFVTLRDSAGGCKGTVEFYSLPGELFPSPSLYF